MEYTEFNVTAELTAALSDEVVDELMGASMAHLSAAVHATSEGVPAVTMTVDTVSMTQALAMVVGSLFGYLPDDVDILAVHVLTTEEFDRRAAGPDTEFVGVPEAAERLGVSQQRVRQLLDLGVPRGLAGTKVGRDWLVSTTSIETRNRNLVIPDQRTE